MKENLCCKTSSWKKSIWPSNISHAPNEELLMLSTKRRTFAFLEPQKYLTGKNRNLASVSLTIARRFVIPESRCSQAEQLENSSIPQASSGPNMMKLSIEWKLLWNIIGGKTQPRSSQFILQSESIFHGLRKQLYVARSRAMPREVVPSVLNIMNKELKYKQHQGHIMLPILTEHQSFNHSVNYILGA